VRDGRFCAHPLLARLGVGKDGAIRASFGVGSTIADVDRLIAAIDQLIAAGPTWTYARVDGRYALIDDPRPLPDFAGATRGPASPCEAA